VQFDSTLEHFVSTDCPGIIPVLPTILSEFGHYSTLDVTDRRKPGLQITAWNKIHPFPDSLIPGLRGSSKIAGNRVLVHTG
jgi:hypothetical protein